MSVVGQRRRWSLSPPLGRKLHFVPCRLALLPHPPFSPSHSRSTPLLSLLPPCSTALRTLSARQQHDNEVKRLEWSPCGSRLATTSSSACVNVWHVRSMDERGSPALEQTLVGHKDTVFDVAWVPPGSLAHELGARLMSASHDKTVRAWGQEAE